MSKKYLFLILIVGLFSLLITVLVLKNYNNLLSVNKLSPKNPPNIEDVSDKFVITPDNEYSLSDKNIIIPPANTFSATGIPRRIEEIEILPGIPERIEIKTKVNNSFSKPIWAKGKDCNHHGVLEKKTMMGWVVADEESCQKEKQSVPGRFFNNGVDELYHVILTKGAKGLYRIRINLLYGCKASKDTGGNLIYGDCEGEAISYSPTFKIVN